MTIKEQRVIDRLARLNKSVTHFPESDAEMGPLDSDGNAVDPTLGLPHPYVWVRKNGSRHETRAKNLKVPDDIPGLPVKVAVNKETTELEVMGIDPIRGPVFLGNAAASTNVPRLLGGTFRTEIPSRNFKPGRLKVVSGLTLYVEAFWYTDSNGDLAYWPGLAGGTVTVTPPAQSGGFDQQQYSVVTFSNDATTPGLTLTDVATASVTLPKLHPVDIVGATLPDEILIGAVYNKTTTTAFADDDFEDLRIWIGAAGGGGGTGDFLADGSVPMTGDFDAGANNVTNVDVLEVNEVAAPATPAAGKVAVYAKSDGKLYAKDDAGTEYDLTAQGSATLPAFGTGVTKTLSSGVAAAGSDRHLALAAETGTADDLIEVSGLSVGDECILRADTGDTITVKHNDAGATDKIILYNSADIALSGDKTLKLVKTETGKVVQYVDEKGAGVGGAVSGQEVRIRVYREVLASAGVFDVEDTELLTGWSFTDFEHLQIRLRAFASVTTVGAYPIKMYYNNDKTDGNYSSGRDFGTASSTPNINYIGGSAAGASGTDLTIDLDFINETGVRRTAKAHGFDSRGSNNDSNSLFVHVWENTAAINRVAFEVGNATNTFQSGAILEIIGIYYES